MTIMFIKNESYNSDEWKLFQKYQLYILTKFVELCEQNNLKYHLAFGSLLGCVRDGRMIPWDDDIDVGMPYNDYKKFISIIESKPEGFEDFKFLTSEKCPASNFVTNFGVFSYTKIKCVMSDNKDYRPYIWIDVYPCFRFYSKTLSVIAITLVKSKIYYKYTNKKTYMCGKILNNLKLYHVGEFLLDKMKFNSKKSYWYNVDNDISHLKKIPPVLSLKTAKFNDIKVYIPENYDEILKTTYGKYSIKPPENEQNKFLRINKIDFKNLDENFLKNLFGELND